MKNLILAISMVTKKKKNAAIIGLVKIASIIF
jgi:hypothetical protein